MFATKFCAEWPGHEIHCFHSDHFRDRFYGHDSGPKSRPRSQEMSPSEKNVHTNIWCSSVRSVVNKCTALAGTTFVTISMFVSRGHFQATFGQPSRNFQTKCMQYFGNLQVTLWQLSKAFGQISDNFRQNFGQSSRKYCNIRKCTGSIDPYTSLFLLREWGGVTLFLSQRVSSH